MTYFPFSIHNTVLHFYSTTLLYYSPELVNNILINLLFILAAFLLDPDQQHWFMVYVHDAGGCGWVGGAFHEHISPHHHSPLAVVIGVCGIPA